MPQAPTKTLHNITVLTLAAIFFLLAMGVTLLGSSIYRTVAAAADDNYAQRTALSYLVNQIRRADTAGSVEIISTADGDVLLLSEQTETGMYLLRLYCYDGNLCELYTDQDITLDVADGVAVLPLQALQLEQEDRRLKITVTTEDGTKSSTVVAQRSSGKDGDP